MTGAHDDRGILYPARLPTFHRGVAGKAAFDLSAGLGFGAMASGAVAGGCLGVGFGFGPRCAVCC